MKPIHYAALTLLGAVWGASFLFIGLAVPDFGPLNLMLLRVLIAGLIMLGVARLTLRRGPLPQGPLPQGPLRQGNLPSMLRLREKWRNYLIVGLFNSALPFTLIAFSELQLPVSLATILNSTTPLFTALAAAAWGSETLGGRKLAGLLLGVAGVIVLMGGAQLAFSSTILIAVLASLLAALSYGVGTVYAARHISGLPATLAAAVQLLAAAVWLAVPGTLAAPATRPSTLAIAALAAMILLSTTFAYVLFFYLLKRVGPTRTAGVTFLVPIFGSVWAVLFLHESFSPGMLAGMVIILFSVKLVMGAPPEAMAVPVAVEHTE